MLNIVPYTKQVEAMILFIYLFNFYILNKWSSSYLNSPSVMRNSLVRPFYL